MNTRVFWLVITLIMYGCGDTHLMQDGATSADGATAESGSVPRGEFGMFAMSSLGSNYYVIRERSPVAGGGRCYGLDRSNYLYVEQDERANMKIRFTCDMIGTCTVPVNLMSPLTAQAIPGGQCLTDSGIVRLVQSGTFRVAPEPSREVNRGYNIYGNILVAEQERPTLSTRAEIVGECYSGCVPRPSM